MKIPLHTFLLILGTFLLVGCHSHRRSPVITPAELEEIKDECLINSMSRIPYYMGSDEQYDYFYIDIPLSWNTVRKAHKLEQLVKERFPFTRKKESWRLVQHSSDIIWFFAKNKEGVTVIQKITLDELMEPLSDKYTFKSNVWELVPNWKTQKKAEPAGRIYRDNAR